MVVWLSWQITSSEKRLIMDQGTPGKSLIKEVEKLREAVVMLCGLQKELAQKVEAALKGQIKVYELTKERTRTCD
jgi:hypothetical protein